MSCPACGSELVTKTVHGVDLDICEGSCGGVWFDATELTKFDEQHEEAEELLAVVRDESVNVDPSTRYHCIRCEDVVMARHFFSVKHEVEIDECPGCNSIWLDGGELETIRSLFESEAARREAGREEFAQEFGAELAAMSADAQSRLQKTQRFANLFKFICPSQYVPGKQSWGAF